MANTFGENMADKKLTVKSLRVLQEVDSPSINSIKSELAQTNQTIASLQGVQEKYWNSIADDNIITPEEKRTLYKEKQTLDTEYSIVIKNAENMTDYVDYEPLIEAYNNLNSYLAMIKVFESMSSNTKIDDRSEFYSVYDAYYQALNNVNQAILGHTTVGEIIVDNPDMITGLKAVASEEYIYVSFNPLDANIKNNIQRYVYSLNKGDGVWFNFNSQQNGFYYYFDRIIDGFPESDVLENWEWKVQAVSVYGKESEESRSVNTNIDTYGTWIPEQPEIITTEQKRFISFSFSQKLSSKEVYGQLRYGLTIQNPLKDGEVFYTPALDKIPTENEDNYKLDTNDSVFVTSYFSQSLPLTGQNNKKWKIKQWQTIEGEDVTTRDSVSYNDTLPVYPSDAVLTYNENGQIIGVSYSETVETLTLHYEYTLVDMPSPIDTMYRYKVVMWNKTSNQFYDVEDILTVYARANSASDLVDNAITQNALAPDAVTADKIAAGTITAEQIAAEDILVKGARAGMVSAEGLIVDNSAFLASEALSYNYIDPETNEKKTYTATAGEFFVGNSPDVNDNRDKVDFLHYIPGVGFWFKIKNFIVKGLATIIQNVFRVKKSGAEDSESFFTVNSTDETDGETKTPANTVKVNGQILSDTLHCPNISLKENVYKTISPLDLFYEIDYLTIINEYVFFTTDYSSTQLWVMDINFSNVKNIIKSNINIRGVIKNNDKLFIYGDGYVVENNSARFYNIEIYNFVDFTLDKKQQLLGSTQISKIFEYKQGFVFLSTNGNIYHTTNFESAEEIYFSSPITYQDYPCFYVNNEKIIFAFRGNDYKFYFTYSNDAINFQTLEINFLVQKILEVKSELYAFENTSFGVNIYKWDAITETLILVTFYEDISAEDFVYDAKNDKLLAMEKDLIIFDGEQITTKTFLPEIQKKLIAVTDEYYLIQNTETNEFFSVKKDDEFLPIISDDKITEQNTWSAKLLSEKLDKIYPVGSIYMSVVDNSPEIFYGGFWVKLKDRFLLGAGDETEAGMLGGKKTVELSIDNLPSHTHSTKITDNGHTHTTNGNVSSTISGKSYMLGGTGTDVHKSETRASNSAKTGISITVNSTGSGNPFSIMPPFIVVHMWKRVLVKYTLNFDSNCGLGSIANITDEPMVIILPENSFIREGYVFKGYNTKQDGSGKTYLPGDNFYLEDNTTLFAIWESIVSISTGTYTPESFRNLISQFISKGGSRTCKNEFTATVNNTTITVPANSTIYYTSSYDGVETIGFGTDSIGPLGGSFSTYKQYIVYANTDKGSFFSNYTNFTITVDDITFN